MAHFNKRYNRYDLSGDYGVGYTSKGEEFYFDLEDYDKIKDYCWVISKTTDTVCARMCGTNKLIVMHRLVMDVVNAGRNVQVDHIHHNRHDNRKSELRICNNSQNSMNKGLQSNNTSGVAGVSWDEKDKLWHAYIQKNHERTSRWFKNYDDAVAWRLEMQKKIFGEYEYVEH